MTFMFLHIEVHCSHDLHVSPDWGTLTSWPSFEVHCSLDLHVYLPIEVHFPHDLHVSTNWGKLSSWRSCIYWLRDIVHMTFMFLQIEVHCPHDLYASSHWSNCSHEIHVSPDWGALSSWPSYIYRVRYIVLMTFMYLPIEVNCPHDLHVSTLVALS